MRRSKAPDALLTISELADLLGRPTHHLRYWETRFTQLRPLTRAGRRRYYRPADVALARRINDLLVNEQMSFAEVKALLDAEGTKRRR